MKHLVDIGGATKAQTVRKLAARPAKRLYSLKEAAEYLGRSDWSVRRLIWDGVLPSVAIKGRVHIDVYDLDDLVERSKVREAP